MNDGGDGGGGGSSGGDGGETSSSGAGDVSSERGEAQQGDFSGEARDTGKPADVPQSEAAFLTGDGDSKPGADTPPQSAGDKAERANEEAEASVNERLGEFPERGFAQPEDGMKSGHVAEWRPNEGENGEGKLLLNQNEWDKLSPQEQNAILAHEQSHMQDSKNGEPYTPYRELEAKHAGLEEWQKQQEQYESATGQELEFTNKGLEQDMEVTDQSFKEFEQGKDILDTRAGQRAMQDYQAFYSGLDGNERQDHLRDLSDHGYNEEDASRWLGRDLTDSERSAFKRYGW